MIFFFVPIFLGVPKLQVFRQKSRKQGGKVLGLRADFQGERGGEK